MSCIHSQKQQSVTVISVYRPTQLSVGTFVHKLGAIIIECRDKREKIFYSGDVNIHLDTDEPNAKAFSGLLADHGLVLSNSGPKHIKGHTLDLLAAFDHISRFASKLT